MRAVIRVGMIAASAVLAVSTFVGIPSTASAKGLPLDGAHPPPAQVLGATGLPAGVDDFLFDSFDAVYRLGIDGGGHSTLHTVETLVAEFPAYDQNRGIIRSIPTDYDGHHTRISVQRVTDASGHDRSFSVGTHNEFTTVTIAVPQGQYVHGEQTYRIDYTQIDVTRYFANTDDDEFYWDVNGTGWAQAFTSVSARVQIAPSLRPKLTGSTACYFGPEGSTQRCALEASGGLTIGAKADALGPYQTMTVAIGFAPHTFSGPAFNLLDVIPLTFLLGLIAELLAVIGGIVVHVLLWRRRTGAPIVAQYEPPAGVSALLAANIIGASKKGMAASIVDLAVRGKLRILQRPAHRDTPPYGVQRLSTEGLLPDEDGVVNALFGYSFFRSSDGSDPSMKWFSRRDTTLGDAVRSLTTRVELEAGASGLRKTRHPAITTPIAILAVVGAVLMFVTAFTDDSGLAIALGVIGANLGVWVAIGVISFVSGLRPLTVPGSQLYDRLLGLKLYIQLAEADRLEMLQSVTGAERVDTDGAQVVTVYERLLPYAVLFGLEKQWGAELAKYYGATSPDWYEGSSLGVFNVAVFSAGIGSLSSNISTSSSSSSSSGSSSSGGSGGGGSSGGGGGGGGGGGI